MVFDGICYLVIHFGRVILHVYRVAHRSQSIFGENPGSLMSTLLYFDSISPLYLRFILHCQ